MLLVQLLLSLSRVQAGYTRAGTAPYTRHGTTPPGTSATQATQRNATQCDAAALQTRPQEEGGEGRGRGAEKGFGGRPFPGTTLGDPSLPVQPFPIDFWRPSFCPFPPPFFALSLTLPP